MCTKSKSGPTRNKLKEAGAETPSTLRKLGDIVVEEDAAVVELDTVSGIFVDVVASSELTCFCFKFDSDSRYS